MFRIISTDALVDFSYRKVFKIMNFSNRIFFIALRSSYSWILWNFQIITQEKQRD